VTTDPRLKGLNQPTLELVVVISERGKVVLDWAMIQTDFGHAPLRLGKGKSGHNAAAELEPGRVRIGKES
jgi:hypothetical protein